MRGALTVGTKWVNMISGQLATLDAIHATYVVMSDAACVEYNDFYKRYEPSKFYAAAAELTRCLYGLASELDRSAKYNDLQTGLDSRVPPDVLRDYLIAQRLMHLADQFVDRISGGG